MTKKLDIKNKRLLIKDRLLLRERVQPSIDNHQLEFVAEFKGFAFVNDAKSIRVTATRYSLEMIETSVVLIIGGDDATNDYSILVNQIKQKVVAIIYLGENSDKILKHCSTLELFFSKANTINEAIQIASCIGQSGDVVLFSPACQVANENYIKRGNEFKQIVNQLSV